MSENKAIQPIAQRTVTFYGDQLLAVQAEDGTILVPVRHLCDLLGVAWSAQRLRLNRDPVLSEELTPVIVTITHDHGQSQDVAMQCLPVDYVSGFLFGISALRVKDEIRPRLIRYQRECHKVLAEAFQSGRLTAPDAILTADSPAAKAYQLAMAVADLARHQFMMEVRLDSAESRLEDVSQRIETIESQLGQSDRHVSAEQASQLSQAVKAVAGALSERSGRNEYGGVYGELYRRFGITSYKLLPAPRFQEAMNFLTQWFQQVSGSDELPF